MIKRKLSVVYGAIVLFAATLAHPNDIVDLQEYGYCAVATIVDAFTDAETHRVYCSYDDSGNDFMVEQDATWLDCYGTDRWVVYLELGDLLFHVDDTVDVKYRFDKRTVGEGNWNWDGEDGYAYSFSSAIAVEFRDGIATSDRLVFQIGDEKRGTIAFLDEDMNAAFDFQDRCDDSFYSADSNS